MGYRDAIRQVFPTVFLDEMNPSSPEAKDLKQVETTFTLIVGALRAHTNPRLARLGSGLWDILHHRHVHTGLTLLVRTMTFIATERKEERSRLGTILIPPTWSDLLLKEPSMGTGAVIFNGSQALDFYNDRIGKDRDPMPLITARAQNYEAEFLRTLGATAKLNVYQRGLLEMFPRFDEKYVYDYRPVAPEVS